MIANDLNKKDNIYIYMFISQTGPTYRFFEFINYSFYIFKKKKSVK